MPSPRDTKSKSELNWLVMILWLNTTPRSLVAISSVRRNPESLGIEIMGSSMQIECGSGNTAEDVGNLSGRQSRCNRGLTLARNNKTDPAGRIRARTPPQYRQGIVMNVIILAALACLLGVAFGWAMMFVASILT